MRVNPSILLLTFPLFYDNTEDTLYDIRMACYFCTIYEYGQHYNSLHTFLIYLYDNRHTIITACDCYGINGFIIKVCLWKFDRYCKSQLPQANPRHALRHAHRRVVTRTQTYDVPMGRKTALLMHLKHA